MRKQVLTMTFNYLMDEGTIDLFAVLDHLKSNGIEPNQEEVDDIALTVDLINTELDLVRSLRLPWDVKRFNKLAYGI